MSRSSSPRTGVVLAAGFGSRLAGSNGSTDLKPLTPVAGMPLILRALDNLSIAGCERAVVVLGYEPHRLRANIKAQYEGPLDVDFAFNRRFEMQNGLSVLAARPLVEDTFMLVMADHIVDAELMELAQLHFPPADGAILLVDYKLDTIFDMDDATKVLEHGNRVQKVGKKLTMYNCVDTGIFLCTRELMDALQDVFDAEGDASLSDGVRLLADRGRMHTLDIGTAYWQDVDTPEMLMHAEALLQMRAQAAA